MTHPDHKDDLPELDIHFEHLSDEEAEFVELEPEIPTQRFNGAVRELLKDEQLMNDQEPTRNTNHFELLRTAFREGNLETLKSTLQMINLLFLGDHIDHGDLAFDMDQVKRWLQSSDSDHQVHVNLSDESYVRITIEGPKDQGEPSFFFSNPDIQRQFEITGQAPILPGE